MLMESFVRGRILASRRKEYSEIRKGCF